MALMTDFPTIATERLVLRQFQPADAEAVRCLAGAKEVAAGTFLPHPYEAGTAEKWIAGQQQDHEAGKALTFAIVLAGDQRLVGSIGMEIVAAHEHARLTYWLGFAHWNQGYCTEAVKALLEYGFTHLNLHRIYAPHFHNNPASGRVLRKVGMTYEGRMREHYIRFGQLVDVEIYGMLRQEFMNRRSSGK
jgi:RimJ/RimL family protein N-acetyltransferase